MNLIQNKALELSLFLSLPASIALAVASEEIISALFGYGQFNQSSVLNSAKAGLTTMEHWYGLPEALFYDKTVQNYPPNYNYQNEQHRFEEAGKLWEQSAKPYSEHWNNVMNELLKLDFTAMPAFNNWILIFPSL